MLGNDHRINSNVPQKDIQSAKAVSYLLTHFCADEPVKMKLSRATSTPGPVDSPSPSKKTKFSPGTSSLSEVADSPEAAAASAHGSPAKSDVSMSDAEDNRIIHGQPPIPQQGFFPDPLAPDPVIYHIREVAPDMPDAQKKEIYSVTAYPTKDLSDQIAGTPPDKDFSNAKPTNQVAANTFLTYVEPYLRPLAEEDMAFLRERVGSLDLKLFPLPPC